MTSFTSLHYANRTRMAKSLKNDDAKLKGLRGLISDSQPAAEYGLHCDSSITGGILNMKESWLTPEEIQYRRERKEKMIYLLLPVSAIIIGAAIAFLTQMTY